MLRCTAFLLFLFATVFVDSCMDNMPACNNVKNYCAEPDIQMHCPFTCGVCSTGQPDPCFDKIPSCIVLKGSCGEEAIKEECPVTCGVCAQNNITTISPFSGKNSTTLKPVTPAAAAATLKQSTVPPATTVKVSTKTVTIPQVTTQPITTEHVTTPSITTQKATTVRPTTTTRKVPPTTTAPCKDTSPNCGVWAKNGFCTNTFYPPEQRKAYCGKTCNMC